MEVMCIQEAALYVLVEQVTERIKEKFNRTEKWISDEEAMKMLNITSKTTLHKFRDEGHIRFSQPERKIILYDSESIDLYLEKHARNTF